MMRKTLIFSLPFLTLFITLTLADYNILNQKNKNVTNTTLKKYCESWRFNVELNNIRGFDVVPQECTDYIGKYITSNQFKADSSRTIEECELYLNGGGCYLKGDGKDAWIFDVDDTLLSTLPYFKTRNFGGEKVNISSMEEWMKERKAPALKHTLKLFHKIKERGYKIFLISSRRECIRDATVDNLIQVRFHGWTKLILRGVDNEYNKGVEKYKAEARKKLVEGGYRIWGIVGDQWSSFAGIPTAIRTFKLPNSMYYVA